MSNDIESRLKAALRPVAPSEQFSQRLIAQAQLGRPVRPKFRGSGIGRPLAWWLSASLAASVVLGVGVRQHLQEQRFRQSGLEARREVLEALRMTSQKLDLAYEAVKNQSAPLADEKSGTQT
jgi:hypothetical protein